MDKYKTKSRVVEAEQWFPETNHYDYIVVCQAFDGAFGMVWRMGNMSHTYIHPGDYMVRTDPEGEPVVIEADYFEMDYELVTEEPKDEVVSDQSRPVIWTKDDLTSERREKWGRLLVEDVRKLKQDAEEKIDAIMGELYLATGIKVEVVESVLCRSVIPGGNPENYRAFYRTTIEASI